jgi:thioredoxin-related protein
LTPTGEIITRIPGYAPKEDVLFILKGVKDMQRTVPEIDLPEVLPQTKKSIN